MLKKKESHEESQKKVGKSRSQTFEKFRRISAKRVMLTYSHVDDLELADVLEKNKKEITYYCFSGL